MTSSLIPITQSQNDDESSIDTKKNATILQAFSTTNLQNTNNNEGNIKSNDELIKDGDEVGGDEADPDSKIWLSNAVVISTAPPIYNNISTSHSLNTTSSSPSWQSTKTKTADSENMVFIFSIFLISKLFMLEIHKPKSKMKKS